MCFSINNFFSDRNYSVVALFSLKIQISTKRYRQTTNISIKMNLCAISLLLALGTQFLLCSPITFIINQPVMNESVVLGKIIGNFFTKYFVGDSVYMSINWPFSSNVAFSQMDAFYNHLFKDSTATMFDVHVLSHFTSSNHHNRIPFNLILIDDNKLLQ